jgi:transcriptional regulator with XRE-family HTH domain
MPNPGLGRRLRVVRERLNLTQEALAREVGVTKVSVARYEAGRIPRAEVLDRIARLAGVTVSSLLRTDNLPRSGDRERKAPRPATPAVVARVLPLLDPDWNGEPWRQLSKEAQARYEKRVRKALDELKTALEEYRSLLIATGKAN